MTKAKNANRFVVPDHIRQLNRPIANDKAAGDRRVWSIPLNGVWLPYFMATNITGQSAIPAEVLGAPLRLAREEDGTPKFTKKGKPVIRVVKELADQVKLTRENFMFGLTQFTANVQKAMPDEYKAEAQAAVDAGTPIVQKDAADLTAYYEAVAEATAATAGSEQAAEGEKTADKEKELVAA